MLGRDHAAPHGREQLQGDRELFEKLGDIGITPVFFDTIYFSDAEGDTVEQANPDDGVREISGTQIRQLLAGNQSIPAWCMRDELSDWLVDSDSTADVALCSCLSNQ